MHQPRDQFRHLENPDLRELLCQDSLPADTVIEADDNAEITIVDGDVHHWPVPPTAEELAAYAAAVWPKPDVWWISHGRGLKLVYVGPAHKERALAAAFSLPVAFSVELLRRTRHPNSRSTAHVADCGSVNFSDDQPPNVFEFLSVGSFTPELREKALEALGLEANGRYHHDRCPIDPGACTTAEDCVVTLDSGIYCHRCANHGHRCRDGLPPGYRPFADFVANPLTQLDELATERVHWTHAVLVLRHQHSNLSDDILRRAYWLTLVARYGESDGRLPKVFSEDLDVVRGDGLWLDAARMTPTQMDNDAANALPYVQYLGTDSRSGDSVIKVDTARRAQIKHRTPRGYTPVRPYVGITFSTDENSIPVVKPPGPRYPIRLLDDPLPENEAFEYLERHFPRLDRRYLKACLAAAICAESRIGQPEMLLCTGPSGSGKEQHIRLAASFLGEDIVKVPLKDDEEHFMRFLGFTLASGRRFLVIDELGKTRNLAPKLKPLLQISGTIQWRPLYQNHFLETPVRAAFFLPCVRFPDFLSTSQEFLRRTRRAHLHRVLPDWADTSGGDTAAWRDRHADHAHISNSLLTHVWRLSYEFDFRYF